MNYSTHYAPRVSRWWHSLYVHRHEVFMDSQLGFSLNRPCHYPPPAPNAPHALRVTAVLFFPSARPRTGAPGLWPAPQIPPGSPPGGPSRPTPPPRHFWEAPGQSDWPLDVRQARSRQLSPSLFLKDPVTASAVGFGAGYHDVGVTFVAVESLLAPVSLSAA